MLERAEEPLFFQRFDADSPTADYTGRNEEIYKYLQMLTSKAIPGFGGKFVDKYTAADRDQILTEILDYIRSTNLYDDNLGTGGGQFTNKRTGPTAVEIGHGQVTPLRIGTTMGFGRFTTLSEIAMHFICTADSAKPESNSIEGPTKNKTLDAVLTENEKRIESMLLLEMFSPSQGWTGISPDMQIRIRGLETLAVNGNPLGFPADGTFRVDKNNTATYHGRAWDGSAGFRAPLNGKRIPARAPMPSDGGVNNNTRYPFVSQPITIDTAAGTMAFTGGEITVDIHTGASAPDAANLVQTLKVKLESGTFPIPNLVTTGTEARQISSSGANASTPTSPENWWTFSADGAIQDKKGRIYGVARNPVYSGNPEEGAFVRTDDVIRSVLPVHGDFRLVAARPNVPNSVFQKHRYYDDTTKRMASSLVDGHATTNIPGQDVLAGFLVEGAAYGGGKRPDVPADIASRDANSNTRLGRGDWDTGSHNVWDGAYINKPDEGNNFRGATGAQLPYFDNNQAQQAGGETFFSPNRQIPSAVMFGSLPTGVYADSGAGRAWRTLLFRPDATGAHDGWAKTPRDHLLLDLFWMPIVEPYAISEPFSTAGKINLNYQIAPFTYIKRTTALRALLKSERVIAIPKQDAGKYKGSGAGTYHKEIDAEETLKQFDARFKANKPFRSASEICEMYLVPEGQTEANMKNFWSVANGAQDGLLTGDNLRERPYASLYPRLTTKSNVYSVHVYVQTLRQRNRTNAADWNKWDPATDMVTGEYRGTTVIERYIDLEDPALPDFARLDASSNESLDNYCKLRVIMNRKREESAASPRRLPRSPFAP
ncbi:MAG: Verru_Chthon cassette protein A [Verrucomicrobiota bacterium]|nr:Verru_Chthon cassette protein A [Verrucomicrobiota bacterium]